jgi:glycosyltransferase involved in cell wall biosynthesis
LAPPLISVIVPVLDGEEHIAEQLAALAGQTYRGEWELVIVDNGCTDGTLEVVRAWSTALPSVTVADARARRGLNHARNVGTRAARGDFLAFCDADDVVTPGWLEALAASAPHADIVGGRLEWDALNDPMVRAWRPQAPMTDLVVDHGFLRYAPGGNLGVWAPVARAVGWDERFTFGSSDHDFAWRAQLAGHRLAFAPAAVVQQRFRRTIGATARQSFRYGHSGPRLYRSFRDAGMARPDTRRALVEWRRLLRALPDLLGPRERRGRWVQRAAFRAGRVAGSLRAGVVCL